MPEHTGKMRDDINHKVAPTEEHKQGTETSKHFVVDLNTGLLKEYIGEMDRRVEGCMCLVMLVCIIFKHFYINVHSFSPQSTILHLILITIYSI